MKSYEKSKEAETNNLDSLNKKWNIFSERNTFDLFHVLVPILFPFFVN